MFHPTVVPGTVGADPGKDGRWHHQIDNRQRDPLDENGHYRRR